MHSRVLTTTNVAFILTSLLLPALNLAQDKVDTSQLNVQLVRAFPNLKPRRPVVITNAADGSGRLFTVTQQGVIHAFMPREDVEDTETFLDIEDRVTFVDKENEEGLLGLAFHPKFKENGQFFVYYTSKKHEPHTSVVSRFRCLKGDTKQGDVASEEVLLTIPQPFWNHNGGGLVFGPDGFLYIGLGDGGSANDPNGNGQNPETLLGSILRIDVDTKTNAKPYGIPQDNPFVGKTKARPEIFAYGFRNPWGLSFDAEKRFWVADVGQNLWEEIDLVTNGGNYGWKLREGKHKFLEGSDADPKLIDPIWEYHHDWGKSITGGHVYSGQKVPELAGHYVYGDYVSGRVWGLKLDAKTNQVVANRPISAPQSPFNVPLVAFGKDEAGEVYASDSFGKFWQFAVGLPEGKFPLVYEDNFEAGADHWQPMDAKAWKLKVNPGKKPADENTVFSQHLKKSSYAPPHRSPFNIALLNDVTVTDFEFNAKVLSTHEDYNHRDCVLVFGYQDPAHFYYVHLGRSTDDHANQIFIVNDSPRTKISLTTTKGTPWDEKWHNVRVVRQVKAGTIEIYFDDMTKPVMTAKDETFTWGRVGLGTFDDTADFDQVQLFGNLKK